MGADGDQGALAAQVLVQLVLKVNEAGIASLIEGDASQDRTSHKWAYERCLWLYRHPQRLLACMGKG